MKDRETIRFNVLRNALYHSARRRTLERIDRSFSFLVVLLGASAMGAVTDKLAIDPIWIGAAIATVGALQLVIGFGRAAREHQVLQRDYYWLLADIEAAQNPDEAELAQFYSRMIRITGDEPPTLRAVDARAYNDALGSIGAFDNGELLRIPLHHRLLGGFVPFDGYHYVKRNELPAR